MRLRTTAYLLSKGWILLQQVLGIIRRDTKLAIMISIAAVALVSGLLMNQMPGPADPRATYGTEFGAEPLNDFITVERGKSVSVPVHIKAPVDEAMIISLFIEEAAACVDGESNEPVQNGLTLALDKARVHLLKEVGDGIKTRDIANLSIMASIEAQLGIHSYSLIAYKHIGNGEAVGSARPVYITVT